MSQYSKKQSTEKEKRSLLSYICPCFRFKIFQKVNIIAQQQLEMNNTQETHSTIPFDQSKPPSISNELQQYVSNSSLLNKKLERQASQQSGIYIKFDARDHQKSQNQDIQHEYELFTNNKHQENTNNYPINKYPQNKLILIGDKLGKMLCKVKSIYIKPSQSAIKKQLGAEIRKQKSNNPVIQRFWEKRYFLFQKFDQGIKLDQQSWFSVTPEAVAEYIAERVADFQTVLDGFCGAGGDSIKLGSTCKKVYCNDIDESKVTLLLNNAAIYGIDNLQVSTKDFFDLEFKRKQLDAVYLAPPWGGPEYYNLQKMMPQDFVPSLSKIIQKAISLSDNIILMLPKNTDIQSLPQIIYSSFNKQGVVTNSCSMQLEKIYFQGKFKFIAIFIGSRVNRVNLGDQLQYIYRYLAEGQVQFVHKRVIKKIREEQGMTKTLNLLFQCQIHKHINKKRTIYEHFIDHAILNGLITQDKVKKLDEIEENDAIKQVESKIQKKRAKMLVKSTVKEKEIKKSQVNIVNLSYNQIHQIPNNDKIEQTASYISSFNESKIAESILVNSNIENIKEGVKIQVVNESNPVEKSNL